MLLWEYKWIRFYCSDHSTNKYQSLVHLKGLFNFCMIFDHFLWTTMHFYPIFFSFFYIFFFDLVYLIWDWLPKHTHVCVCLVPIKCPLGRGTGTAFSWYGNRQVINSITSFINLFSIHIIFVFVSKLSFKN